MTLKLIEVEPTGLRDLGSDWVDAFVTFIDILGFTDLVSGLDAPGINARLDAMQIFNLSPQRRRAELQARALRPMVYQVSDSIIRIQPCALSNSEPETRLLDFFVGELDSLLLAQGNLACNGIFVRGGLTFGKICVHKSRVFGPAFIRAYKLESTVARFPRIVVDKRLCEASDNPIVEVTGRHAWHLSQEHVFERLKKDVDGQWFVQYLSNLYDSHHMEGVTGIDVLRAHRNKVQEQLKLARASGSEDVASKYYWAANYHNALMGQSFAVLDQRLHQDTGESLFVDLD